MGSVSCSNAVSNGPPWAGAAHSAMVNRGSAFGGSWCPPRMLLRGLPGRYVLPSPRMLGCPHAHKATIAAVLAMTSALVPFHHQRPCRQGSCLFPGCPLPDGFGFSCHKILLKILHFFFFCIKIFCSGHPHRCSASVSLTVLSGKRQLVLFTPR